MPDKIEKFEACYLQSLSQIKCFATFFGIFTAFIQHVFLNCFSGAFKDGEATSNWLNLESTHQPIKYYLQLAQPYQQEIPKTKLLILSGRNYHVLNVNKRMK